MTHHFNTEIAEKYGIIEAILIENFYFWIQKNQANQKHYHEGRYWTYNSCKAMVELFPYLTERQINYAIEKLVRLGVMYKANFNDVKYDRTLWYALDESVISIYQNCKMESPKSVNGTNRNVEPIPYTNHIETDIHTPSSSPQAGAVPTNKEILEKPHVQLTMAEFREQVHGFKEKYAEPLLEAFYNRWRQKDATGKMRFQKETYWDTGSRLENWNKVEQEIIQRQLKKQHHEQTTTNLSNNFKRNTQYTKVKGTSEARTDAARNWGRSAMAQSNGAAKDPGAGSPGDSGAAG